MLTDDRAEIRLEMAKNDPELPLNCPNCGSPLCYLRSRRGRREAFGSELACIRAPTLTTTCVPMPCATGAGKSRQPATWWPTALELRRSNARCDDRDSEVSARLSEIESGTPDGLVDALRAPVEEVLEDVFGLLAGEILEKAGQRLAHDQ